MVARIKHHGSRKPVITKANGLAMILSNNKNRLAFLFDRQPVLGAQCRPLAAPVGPIPSKSL